MLKSFQKRLIVFLFRCFIISNHSYYSRLTTKVLFLTLKVFYKSIFCFSGCGFMIFFRFKRRVFDGSSMTFLTYGENRRVGLPSTIGISGTVVFEVLEVFVTLKMCSSNFVQNESVVYSVL